MSDNIVRPQFRKSATEQLMDNLRQEIGKPDYDKVSISELLGVLLLLQAEYIERNSRV